MHHGRVQNFARQNRDVVLEDRDVAIAVGVLDPDPALPLHGDGTLRGAEVAVAHRRDM